MSNLQLYKRDACKFDYEFLGRSIQDLASIYGYTPAMIEQEIKIGQWIRKIEPTSLPETSDIEKFATDLEKVTRAKLSIISLFRQIEQQPLIAQIEKAALEKALELTTNIQAHDDKATAKLANVVKAIAALQDRNPINLADQVKEALKSGSGQVVVQIANNIQ